MRTHIAIVGCIVSMLVTAVAAAEKIALTFAGLDAEPWLVLPRAELEAICR